MAAEEEGERGSHASLGKRSECVPQGLTSSPRLSLSPSSPFQSPAALTASGRDRDVGQRRILLGAMPVFLTGLDMHHISRGDLTLFVLGRHDASASRHYENLIAVMGMPPGRGARAKIDDAT